MSYHRIPLKPDDLTDLQQIIENADNTLLSPVCGFGNITYFGDNHLTELYLKTTPHKELVIARISLVNQRIGTGTKILEYLKSFAKTHGFESLVIESTLTPAMNRFALSHGFSPVEHLGFWRDNQFYGNYKLDFIIFGILLAEKHAPIGACFSYGWKLLLHISCEM